MKQSVKWKRKFLAVLLSQSMVFGLLATDQFVGTVAAAETGTSRNAYQEIQAEDYDSGTEGIAKDGHDTWANLGGIRDG